MDKLVSPYQTTFVLGKRGVDNAIIVQELIHTIGRAKGNRGIMAIKIDLKKAYERIEQSFIKEMLTLFNFPENLIKLIMSCVTSVSTSLLLNGGSLDPFLPSKGIRQGDPLSPYLFILCMDFLGHLIKEKCAAKVGPLLKHPEVVRLFHTSFLRTIWSFSLVQIHKIVLPSVLSSKFFVINLGRNLVKLSPVCFFFLLMSILIKEKL